MAVLVHQGQRFGQRRRVLFATTITQLVQKTVARAHHPPPAHLQPGFGSGFDVRDTVAAVERFRLPVEDVAQVRQLLFRIGRVVSLDFAGKARAILRTHCE